MGDEARPWRDLIVRERMEVDRQFGERVRQSDFSSQEWNLIMTAVEFEIRPTDGEAELVADTSKLDSVMPELERIRSRSPGTPGSATGGGADGGVMDTIRSALGLGGGDRKRRGVAAELAEAYAAALQAHLEDNGRWEQVRRAAGYPSPE